MSNINGLKNCDRIKVSMMFLVILYHSMAIWNRGGWFNTTPANANVVLTYLAGWLNSFHVYVFVFVSGYLYFYLRYECNKYKDIRIFLVKKVKRLLVPYIFVSISWCVPFQLYFTPISLKDFIIKYVLAVSPSQLWFLIMLLGVAIVVRLCFDKVASLNSKQSLMCIVLLFLISIILSGKVPRLFQANAIVKYIPFYLLGMYFRKIKKERLAFPWWILLFIDLVVFGIYDYCVSRNLFACELLGKMIYLITNLLGIFMVLEVSARVHRCKFWESKLYCFLKENNYTLYLFHQQVIFCTVTWFNERVSSITLVLLNFAVSLVVSAMLCMIMNRFRLTRLLIGK